MEDKVTSKEDYNNIPVSYCKDCLSLSIEDIGDSGFCLVCGGTSIQECHIEEWKLLCDVSQSNN